MFFEVMMLPVPLIMLIGLSVGFFFLGLLGGMLRPGKKQDCTTTTLFPL